MKELIKKVNILISLVLIIAGLFIYSILYLSMKQELEKITLENFVLSTQANENLVEQFIIRSAEGAGSLSSRTMIKKKITEYRDGIVSFDELRSYTSALYLDGVNALDEVKGAFRVIDGEVLISYGEGNIAVFPRMEEIHSTEYKIIGGADDVLVAVCSAVKEEEAVLGHDIVFFDMTGIIREINEGRAEFLLPDEEQMNILLSHSKKCCILKEYDLINDGIYTGYLMPIGETERNLYIRIEDDVLFESIQNIAMVNAFKFIFGLIITVLLTNFIMIKKAAKLLVQKEESRMEYEEYANRDSLTGVYSRRFLINWIEKHEKTSGSVNEFFSIVMIDVDNFKAINDLRGHITGDEVLKHVASILTSLVREQDWIIRYGGDEFVLILRNCDRKQAEQIMKRANETLADKQIFNFGITISFGIEEHHPDKEFSASLATADQKMYENKKKKRFICEN